jgi:hypothetical protein
MPKVKRNIHTYIQNVFVYVYCSFGSVKGNTHIYCSRVSVHIERVSGAESEEQYTYMHTACVHANESEARCFLLLLFLVLHMIRGRPRRDQGRV